MTDHADSLLADALRRIFLDTAGPAQRRAAESLGWMPECWASLDEAGLAWIGVPEAIGGAGGDLLQACMLIRLAGQHAVALPVAECTLLGGWLLGVAGLPRPDGAITVPVPDGRGALSIDAAGRVTGSLRVPWSRQVAAIVALAEGPAGDHVLLLDPRSGVCTPGRNVAGEPRDGLRFDSVPVPAESVRRVAPGVRGELMMRGALSRSLLLSGAVDAIAAMTTGYADEREQFGRAISRFQAVAQRLVRLNAEAEAACIAADVGMRRFAEEGASALFEVAAAKTSASRCASEVVTQAHQIHGAIGMTQEYPLHDFTRRVLCWRQEWGSERYWAARAGEEVLAEPGRGLWRRVSVLGRLEPGRTPLAESIVGGWSS